MIGDVFEMSGTSIPVTGNGSENFCSETAMPEESPSPTLIQMKFQNS